MEIEEFLASKTRIRIFKVLYELRELNIRRICQKIGSTHPIVKKNLEIMEKLGLIKCKKYGRIKFYSLNSNDERVRLLSRLVEVWQTK